MKLVIAGSRTVVNIQHLYNAILTLGLGDTVKNEVTEIISGGANGADKLGEILATKLNKTLTIMPAEWDKYGKGAGYRRNEDMAELGDAVLVLYDGISKGSKHMIELAKKHNKKVWVYYVYVS